MIRFLSLCYLFYCCFFGLFFALVFVIFVFAIYQKTSLQNLEIPKPPKMKNAEKQTFRQEQLAQVCSQIVLFLFGVSFKSAFLLKTL